MRNSRDKWVFFHHESKKPLSAAEVQYWRNTFRNVLKVGMEFEMNLPNSTGTCKGDNNSCPCRLLKENDCWQKCVSIKTCQKNVTDETCARFVSGACNGGKCAPDCAKYEFKCIGATCSNFLTFCVNCDQYSVDCLKCDHRYDETKNPDSIRHRITSALQPSNTYGIVNKSGVHSVTTDGSLLGGEGKEKGIEVITIGRRIDYNEFFQMSRHIINMASEYGAYVNERCSIHMHLLTSHYTNVAAEKLHGIAAKINELEKPIPEIVLANFHQLCRRYQNAMTWMCMGLDESERLTRWEKYRVSILDISPTVHSMADVKDKVAHAAGGTKYGWVNYNYVTFDNNLDVEKLHVEMRVLDGMMAPSVVSAIACMFYALVIKAVEISRYGMLRIGDDGWLNEAKKVKHALLNNRKGWNDGDRFSDTSKLGPHHDFLIGESIEFIQQLKHILMKIGPAYQILEQLAVRPVALRRCDGETWEEIEKSFAVPMSEEDIIESFVDEMIDLRIVAECKSFEEWLEEIHQALTEKVDQPIDVIRLRVNDYVDRKRLDGDCIWSDTLGTIVRI